MTLESNSSSRDPWKDDDGAINFLNVAIQLWRRKYIILLGAFVSAGVAFYFTLMEPTYTAYRAAAMLENTQHFGSSVGVQARGTIELVPPQDAGGVQLTVPSTIPDLSKPLNTETLNVLVRSSLDTKVLMDELLAKAGETDESEIVDYEHDITITEIPDTPFLKVVVRMPSRETALEAADALAVTAIEMDRVKFEDDLSRTVLVIEGQLQAFGEFTGTWLTDESESRENKQQSGSFPAAELFGQFSRSAGMAEVRYLEMVSRYEQALAQQAEGYTRLRMVESANSVDDVSPPPPPLARRTITAFLAGVLLVSCLLLFKEYLLWLSRRGTTVRE
jgi:capsular polysaccharide biosynthesis protein